MTSPARHLCAAALLALASATGAASSHTVPPPADACRQAPLSLQVLGSGGPELYPDRAETAYLVRVAGHGRLLVDLGAGAAARFVQAGGRLQALDAIAFTHLHVDHTADLPALVKAGWFRSRSRALPLLGPEGNRLMPGMRAFVEGLFGASGVYRYLHDFLPGGGGPWQLEVREVAPAREPRVVFRNQAMTLTAVAVHHGPVPALAWRIDSGGRSIAISGDMNGDWHTLERLAAGVDVLVAHHAVPEGAGGVARRLHMPPSVIGSVAAAAGAGRLVLTHRMRRTLGVEDGSLAAIRAHYRGPVVFARDLQCFAAADRPGRR